MQTQRPMSDASFAVLLACAVATLSGCAEGRSQSGGGPVAPSRTPATAAGDLYEIEVTDQNGNIFPVDQDFDPRNMPPPDDFRRVLFRLSQESLPPQVYIERVDVFNYNGVLRVCVKTSDSRTRYY
jgi:hypothetical protein